MTTTFEKNVNLNLAFGNARGDIVAPDFGKIRNQAKLVLEETKELLEAAYHDCDVSLDLVLTPKNEPYQTMTTEEILRQILDAQGDITTVNDGVAHIAGFNGDECLQRVYASNLSKFVRSEEEVAPALQYYYDLGFTEGQLYIHGDFPRACIKVTETVTVNGKEYPAGKFLKNMATFKEPDFEDMLTSQPTRQITEIIVTMAAEEGKIGVDYLNGVATMGPNTMARLLEMTEEVSYQSMSADGGVVESYIPAFKLTKELLNDMPGIWGLWRSNVRVFVASPVQGQVTQLTRID